MMELWLAFGDYACKFVIFTIVAVGGIIIGKKLRQRKDAKNIEEN